MKELSLKKISLTVGMIVLFVQVLWTIATGIFSKNKALENKIHKCDNRLVVVETKSVNIEKDIQEMKKTLKEIYMLLLEQKK